MSKVTIIVLTAALALSGCISSEEIDSRARDVIEANGFRSVVMTGHEWYGCGEDDTFSRGFTAAAPSGAQVIGVACGSAFGKGWTVRITGMNGRAS